MCETAPTIVRHTNVPPIQSKIMEPQHTSGNGTGRNDAEQAISTYLTEHTPMNENEARREARSMLRRAAPLVGSAEQLVRPWWTLLLRGALAIAAGILFLRRPVSALAALVLVFGAWTFVDGIIALGAGLSREKSWDLTLSGLIGIVIGAIAIMRPGVGLLVFYALVAIWIMGRGMTEIAWGSHPHEQDGESRGGLIALGVLSFVFGLFLLIAPRVGVPALGVWIGFYAIVLGVALVASAFPLRHAQHRMSQLRAQAEAPPPPR
jgi:uncharacterized membrane protein HdeD (DUF308 family)